MVAYNPKTGKVHTSIYIDANLHEILALRKIQLSPYVEELIKADLGRLSPEDEGRKLTDRLVMLQRSRVQDTVAASPIPPPKLVVPTKASQPPPVAQSTEDEVHARLRLAWSQLRMPPGKFQMQLALDGQGNRLQTLCDEMNDTPAADGHQFGSDQMIAFFRSIVDTLIDETADEVEA